MSHLKNTCTSLTSLLQVIREKKLENEGVVEEDLVADAMALFAQLAGQHHKLVREAESEYDSIYELRDKCEDSQEVLEEQSSYMMYMDTEYDVRPWKSDEDVIAVSQADTHAEIKEKLDTELTGRRKMCEYANSLEDQVASLRKSEQEMRAELEKVRKVMISITTPAFLEGVTPSQNIPSTPLTGPLCTLYQLLSSTVRELPEVTLSVTQEDPLQNASSHYTGQGSLSAETWSLLAPDPQLVVLAIRGGANHVVLRYHSNINIISSDDSFGAHVLGELCPRDDGTVTPHPSLSFAFTGPTLPDLIKEKHLGRVYCWLQELCGLTVITETQRFPVNITTLKFVEHILKS